VTHFQNLPQRSTGNLLGGADEILLRYTRTPLCGRNPLIAFSARYLRNFNGFLSTLKSSFSSYR